MDFIKNNTVLVIAVLVCALGATFAGQHPASAPAGAAAPAETVVISKVGVIDAIYLSETSTLLKGVHTDIVGSVRTTAQVQLQEAEKKAAPLFKVMNDKAATEAEKKKAQKEIDVAQEEFSKLRNDLEAQVKKAEWDYAKDARARIEKVCSALATKYGLLTVVDRNTAYIPATDLTQEVLRTLDGK